jgi:anti-sigma factor RsiW
MSEWISCEEVEGGIAEYLETVLSPDRRRRFDRHLRLCPACRALLRRTRWTIGRLAELPREPMPAGMKERILHLARSDSPSPPPPHRPRRPPRIPRWCSTPPNASPPAPPVAAGSAPDGSPGS